MRNKIIEETLEKATGQKVIKISKVPNKLIIILERGGKLEYNLENSYLKLTKIVLNNSEFQELKPVFEKIIIGKNKK